MTHVAPPAKARHASSNAITDGSVPSTKTGTCTNITRNLPPHVGACDSRARQIA